jgi:hypothetical protein
MPAEVEDCWRWRRIEFKQQREMISGNGASGKGFPVMEVGIEIGKIIKNERKEKNLRNSYFGHGLWAC